MREYLVTFGGPDFRGQVPVLLALYLPGGMTLWAV